MQCTKQIKHEHFLTITGKKIKLARAEKGWTISKLAEISGVTRKTIGELERENKKRVRFSTIEQIAKTLDKNVEYFCTHIVKRVEGE
ncbi:helix-turn-helix domain-containing protein [Bacillus altitudinis]|uniref:helix-turn-helix domain-containing protein n=1 Tax=Bacillus altitudinis TaxID=293387 RepID=UPI002235C16E|nr:helix-turn-helix transcriptional regulator [Bacillus altitudinis]MCW4359521.1 helix-turn-helix domain-containing protein [Bacillus altitudinis]